MDAMDVPLPIKDVETGDRSSIPETVNVCGVAARRGRRRDARCGLPQLVQPFVGQRGTAWRRGSMSAKKNKEKMEDSADGCRFQAVVIGAFSGGAYARRGLFWLWGCSAVTRDQHWHKMGGWGIAREGQWHRPSVFRGGFKEVLPPGAIAFDALPLLGGSGSIFCRATKERVLHHERLGQLRIACCVELRPVLIAQG